MGVDKKIAKRSFATTDWARPSHCINENTCYVRVLLMTTSAIVAAS